jgi:hypothetical protein
MSSGQITSPDNRQPGNYDSVNISGMEHSTGNFRVVDNPTTTPVDKRTGLLTSILIGCVTGKRKLLCCA